MFGSNVLDISIGLLFVFLLVSLICTAVNELIAAAIGSRAKDLERGIRNLLDGTSQLLPPPVKNGGPETLAQQFFKLPLINALSKDNQRPSYIPSQTFAMALIQLLDKASGGRIVLAARGTPGKNVFDSLQEALGATGSDYLKQLVGPLIEEARTDTDNIGAELKKVSDQLELWYNNAMERVAGWYKRRTQASLLIISLLAVFLLNVDSIAIVRALGHNGTLRNALVAAAQKSVSTPPASQPVAAADSQAGNDLRAAAEVLQTDVQNLNQLDLPIGWTWNAPHRGAHDGLVHPDPDSCISGTQWSETYVVRDDDLADFIHRNAAFEFSKILGLLMTAFAASLGAPFWFDILNRVMSIRSTGTPPDETPKSPRTIPQPRPPEDTPSPAPPDRVPAAPAPAAPAPAPAAPAPAPAAPGPAPA